MKFILKLKKNKAGRRRRRWFDFLNYKKFCSISCLPAMFFWGLKSGRLDMGTEEGDEEKNKLLCCILTRTYTFRGMNIIWNMLWPFSTRCNRATPHIVCLSLSTGLKLMAIKGKKCSVSGSSCTEYKRLEREDDSNNGSPCIFSPFTIYDHLLFSPGESSSSSVSLVSRAIWKK